MPEHELKLAGIVEESAVDGPGLRMTIFTQGCPRRCPGCHNPETHDLSGGFVASLETLHKLYLQNSLLAGVTFSGGEPFLQAAPLALLARKVHELGGNVICYTGYYYEDLKEPPLSAVEGIQDLLEETDLLIDGPYVNIFRNLELSFRGSSNQRLLDRIARSHLDARKKWRGWAWRISGPENPDKP